MDMMFDINMSKMGVGFASALSAVENNLGIRIMKESETHHQQMHATNMRIDDVMARIGALELKEPIPAQRANSGGGAADSVGSGGDGWKLSHMIMGFEDDHSRDDIVRKAKKLTENHTPNKYGAIVKVRCKEPSRGQVVSARRLLEDGSAQDGPKWGAFAGGGRETKRERKVKSVVQQMQAPRPKFVRLRRRRHALARIEGYRQVRHGQGGVGTQSSLGDARAGDGRRLGDDEK